MFEAHGMEYRILRHRDFFGGKRRGIEQTPAVLGRKLSSNAVWIIDAGIATARVVLICNAPLLEKRMQFRHLEFLNRQRKMIHLSGACAPTRRLECHIRG